MSETPTNHTDEPNTLGKLFCTYPLTLDEQKRIVSQAAIDGLVRRVLVQYAPKTDMYKEFEKKEKIDGFRSGVKSHAVSKKLFQKLLEYLAQPKSIRHDYCWEIYKRSAIKFVTSELTSLDKLLDQVEPESGEEQKALPLFTEVCRNAFEYDVKPADVSRLYEVWWTERIDNLDELLKLCSEVDPKRAEARRLARINQNLELISASIEKITNDITVYKERQNQLSEDLQTDHAKIEKFEHALQSLETKNAASLVTLQDNLITQLAELDQELKDVAKSVNSVESALTTKISAKSLESQLRELGQETKSSTLWLQNDLNTLIEQIRTEFATKCDDLEGRLSAACAQINEQSQRSPRPSSGNEVYKSPLMYVPASGSATYKLTKEPDFINSWFALMSRNAKSLIANELLFAYQSVFLANRVVVCDQRALDSWLKTLGWDAFTKRLVASPLWTSEADWADGVQYLFGDLGNSKTPRILVIHNYDVAVVECYLIPSLILWSLQASRTGFWTRIFLVPSSQSQQYNRGLLEQAALVKSDTAKPSTKLQLATPQPKVVTSREVPIGVDPKIFTQWLKPLVTDTNELDVLERQFDLVFPPQVVLNFENTVGYARRFFDDSSSVGVGMHHIVLPWLKIAYEDKYDAIESFIQQLPDVAYL